MEITIVEVEWIDAGCEHSAMPIEKAQELKPMPRFNVGYLLLKDADKIIISSGWIDDTNMEYEAWEDNLVIPIGMVKNIRKQSYQLKEE